MKLSSLVTLLFAVATLTPLACKSSKPTSENTDAVDSSRLCRVTFNGDSAMNYARAQCDFGPRTPNSAALKNAATTSSVASKPWDSPSPSNAPR